MISKVIRNARSREAFASDTIGETPCATFSMPPAHRDDIGQELPTIAAARHQAASYLCALRGDNPAIQSDGGDIEINVTDASGLALFSLVTICIEAPTVQTIMGTV